MDTMQNHVMTQVAIIVNDIEKTAQSFADLFGVPIPSINLTDPIEKSQAIYKGQPTKARAKLAFFNMGSLSLELIEPDHEPSTWREFLDTHGPGVHHIAFEVKGMQETVAFLEGRGMPMVQKGEYTGGRYAYIDSQSPLSVMLELLENDNV